MSAHELTLKDCHKQLKDSIKNIYDNYTDLLKTKTEHVNFEVQVKSAEIVRSYQSLMHLVAEIRSFLIINDLVDTNRKPPNPVNQLNTSSPASQYSSILQQPATQQTHSAASDEKLVRLRDEMSIFLYELEIPQP